MIQLPTNRLGTKQIQLTKRNVPLDQIIAVEGQNPLATGIETAGNVLGQALQKRAALREQGQQLAQLAQLAGTEAPTGDTGLTPDLYEKGLSLKDTNDAKKAAAAKARVELELKLEQLKSGYSEFDPATGKKTTYPGVQGLSIVNDPQGNPMIQRGSDYKPKNIPKPIPGGSGGGNSYKNESDLRKEFDKESTDTKKSFNSATKALSLASRGDAIGDTTLAFALTKGALGGQGRITQTEIQQFGPQLGGLPDRVQQGILGLANGKKFDPDVRASIVNMVKQQAVLDSQAQTERENQYTALANNYKFNPKNVVYDIRPPSLRAQLLSPISSSGGAVDLGGGFSYKVKNK